MLRAALALMAAGLPAFGDMVRAENECGPHEAGVEIVCSSSNYDPSEGNILYGHEVQEGDFTIRLGEDVSVIYDREVPGDDVYFLPNAPTVQLSSGVLIRPGEFGTYTGDISLYSSADVTSNGNGIWVGHYGQSGALRLEITGGEITTTGDGARAIRGFYHEGAGEVELTVRGVAIDTAGRSSFGVSSYHRGTGDTYIDVQGGSISTGGEFAYGVYGAHQGEGDVGVNVRGGSVSTEGESAIGVYGWHQGAGDVGVDVRGESISTGGPGAYGVYGWHLGEGDVGVDVRGGSVSTEGESASGVYGLHIGEGALSVSARDLAIDTARRESHGVSSYHQGTGDIFIDVQGGSISTAGPDTYGVYGLHQGDGDMNVDVRGVSIMTEGASASGVLGVYQGEGDVSVDVQGGSVSTAGARAHGVEGFHTGADALDIDLRDTTIATTGEAAHGVLSRHGGSGTVGIVVEGGSIRAAGADASGIHLGSVNEEGGVEFAAPVGGDGYRRQSVSVNAPVEGGSGGNAAGVFLAGGGKVAIGPGGTLGAASRVAILATGGAPRLRVAANLDGRRVAQIISDNWIINDGGETTLLVNGVTLHEGATGATGAEAPNGAWDLTIPASEMVAGRTFTSEDFTETYAPRAAVYEALPGLLLRLHSRGPAGERLTGPGSPAWVRVAGGGGRYTPVQASVGASYDFRRIEVEAGLDVAWGPRLTGTLSVRHVHGWGDVSSPTDGGEIAARGLGGALGLAWTGPQGYYFRGRVSVMDYDVDLSSDRRGTLSKEASAVGHSLGFETGRRFTVSERLKLTPRVWVTRSKIDLGFTDAVQSRLWAPDADRLTAGTGLVAETERVWDAGAQAFALRGSLDLWRTLGDGTAVQVSQGESLQSVSDKTRVLLSLGGVYRWGRVSVSSEVAAGGPGSRDQEYAGFLNLGVQF